MNHLLGSLDTVVFTSLEDEQKIRASVPLCLSKQHRHDAQCLHNPLGPRPTDPERKMGDNRMHRSETPLRMM